MKETSYVIAKDLSLNFVETSTKLPTAPPPITNHVLCMDVSGSMSGDLPRIREQLKAKLPKMVGENDTVSIIWFSGKGQSGVLMESEKVGNLADLQKVNSLIDRWLRPVGLTGFVDPLVKVAEVAKRACSKNGGVASLLWFTDGQENQSSKDEVLKALDIAAKELSAATFIEYGYYTDRPLLTKMAERCGGALVFSESFDSYQAVFDSHMARGPGSAKKISVPLASDAVGGFAFALQGDEVLTFAVSGGAVSVPESTDRVWYVSAGGGKGDALQEFAQTLHAIKASPVAYVPLVVSAAYAAVALYATRGDPKVVKPVLRALGDVALVRQYQNCFGKQAYSAFADAAKSAAFGKGRWAEGFDPNAVPADDAFTVLDMLRVLAEDDGNLLLLNHEAFSYSAIGRGRVDANDVLTTDEREEIATLSAKMTNTKDPLEVAKIAARVAEISNKPEALKFEEDPNAGYPVANLTFNEERPNVSVLVNKKGTVSLSARSDRPASVPTNFPTSVFRNYAIIKDGLVNVKVLPTWLTPATTAKLEAEVKAGRLAKDVFTAKGEVVDGKFRPNEVLVRLDKLPVINAKMVGNVPLAKDLLADEYRLLKMQAEQKVLNSILKEKAPGKVSASLVTAYGESEASWLKGLGLGDTFSPKTVAADPTDQYLAKNLSISVEGFSNLPSLNDVRKAVASKKPLTPRQAIMAPMLQKAEAFLASDAYVKAKDQEKALTDWAEAQSQKTKIREALFKKAVALFAICVGNAWPSDLGSVDVTAVETTVDGATVRGSLEMSEKIEKI